MSLQAIGLLVFFATYGINYFAPFSAAGLIMAVAAIVVAIAIIIRK